MSKRRKPARRTRQERNQPNWLLIGGIIIGAIVVLGLLALALREPEAPTLAQFCQDNPENCVSDGQADAPVTIVEVSDYGCSHCRDFNLQTASLIHDLYVTPGDVRWVVMPFALGTQTIPAATAALCANEQGRFFDYHHKLFELQNDPTALTPSGFILAAEQVGLDLPTFGACFDSGKYDQTIQQNIRAANLVGIRSTPSFFVNDQLLQGNRPLTDFQQQISSALQTANAN
jgi:protein-disulfide isomerase